MILVESTKKKKQSLSLKTYLSSSLFIPSGLSDLRPEIEAILQKENAPPGFIGEVDDIALLRLLALEGEGVAIIPKVGVLQELNDRKIRIIKEFPDFFQSFYVILRKGYLPSKEVQELIVQFQLNLRDSKFFFH